VTSEPGEGTTFHVLLPTGTLDEERERHRPHVPGQVVVTGHPIAVEAVALVMQNFGKEVVAACTGAPDTLHLRVVSDTGEPEATRPRDDAHRLIILGPTATVAASPTAGEYLPLPWTRERLLELLGLEVPDTVVDRVLALPTGMRMLLAEDDATNRGLIAEMLRRMGASVTTVSDGAAAVEEVAGDTYDTVLLDLNMPVMDGLEAVRVIRERLAGVDDLAILALTADPGWMDRSVLMAAGFNGYVLKPTTMAELHVGITKALERLPGAPAVAGEARTGADVTLDTAVLHQLAEDLGDADLVAEAVGVYLDELPGRLVALHRGVESGAAEEVRATAHALKGSSGMLGAVRLHRLCQTMETEASGDLLFQVFGEAEQVETQMRQYLSGVTPRAGTAPAP
jgi:CheY-like chemotaxis protein